uniref:NADH-ubiquinone oxidoreductase chain 4L n=1 Tax=Silax daleus TaxID=3230861 RepID=A0AAU8HNT3_9ECHI
MNTFTFILYFSLINGFLSMIYKKNFFLSILLCLEIILLNLIIFNFILYNINGQINFLSFSLFLIALAAVEASIGISIITLITRNFSLNNIISLNLLKN